MIISTSTKYHHFRCSMLSVFMIAGTVLCSHAGQPGLSSEQLPSNDKQIEQQKLKVKDLCRILSEGGSLTSIDIVGLSKAVIQKMDKGERREIVVATALLYDRLTDNNSMKDTCHSWGWQWQKQALSVLKMSDGKEAAALIERVYRTSLSVVKDLDQLNRIEKLIEAVHPEMVCQGKVKETSFRRSKAKKMLLRKSISLMKEGNR